MSDTVSPTVAVRGFRPGSRGVWITLADPNLVRILAHAGFDWLALDLQHGGLDRDDLVALGRLLGDTGTEFAVRVPALDHVWIGAALDAGATTVIVPQVDTAEQAAAAVSATFYPPRGDRSWGPFAALWGGAVVPPDQANAGIRCAVMVESATALANVDAIAAVPGLDWLFVGPFDLSLSLGRDVEEVVRDADGPLRTIAEAGRRHGLGLAAFGGSPERAAHLHRFGFDCLAVTTDAGILAAGAAQALAAPLD